VPLTLSQVIVYCSNAAEAHGVVAAMIMTALAASA
jgi:hypothetical protein